ncbi:hypothetical protein AMYX_02340 [Anaeromyxobacter diazotrophicus]|uniref:Uncharacterized protein n=1 Tax=Anaeromyxobacter diazotrophicus TaxID=2590199 RepID=A0A7I9VGH7_9BACT|nr:hypothetical protein AMYX_02340 [Anaeromyxobacter diazotrophicus]
MPVNEAYTPTRIGSAEAAASTRAQREVANMRPPQAWDVPGGRATIRQTRWLRASIRGTGRKGLAGPAAAVHRPAGRLAEEQDPSHLGGARAAASVYVVVRNIPRLRESR